MKKITSAFLENDGYSSLSNDTFPAASALGLLVVVVIGDRVIFSEPFRKSMPRVPMRLPEASSMAAEPFSTAKLSSLTRSVPEVERSGLMKRREADRFPPSFLASCYILPGFIVG
jgi:hypothetical protein